ncbi:MAG: flippase-like domain-containing protein [Candidatus Magnetoovum sp. WYHC-5]|nr:flippase-like domain-containing protein [Candidatus Magnetoovum sp. WYHC-5]
MERTTGKKLLTFLIKAVVSIVILYFLFRKIGLKEVITTLKGMDIVCFSSASIAYLFAMYISSIRLRFFIEDNIAISKLFALNMIGAFFNNLLPGATGGDAVKLYYIYKHTGKGVLSAASVFMDRYIGLFSLITIGFVSFLFGYKSLVGTGVEFFIPSLFIMFFVSSVIIFGLRIGRRFPRLAAFYDYFHMYMKQKKIIAASILLSVVVQLIVINAAYLICVGLGANIRLFDILIFLPVIITLTSIPISISGIGIRESAFVIFLGIVGVKENMAVAISFAQVV